MVLRVTRKRSSETSLRSYTIVGDTAYIILLHNYNNIITMYIARHLQFAEFVLVARWRIWAPGGQYITIKRQISQYPSAGTGTCTSIYKSYIRI